MGIIERKVREKEHRREEILDAAQKVFFEKGLLASTMDEVAESAELSKGTLYLYYKSKEDIYLAVMMRGMQQLNQMLEGVSDEHLPAPVVLDRFGETYIQFFHDHRAIFRMMAFFQTPHFHKQVSEQMIRSCTAQNQRIWDLVVKTIERGMQDEMIRLDLKPVDISIILWSSATALMLRMDAENEMWIDRMNIDLRKTLDTSNRLLMESILTPRGRQILADYRNKPGIVAV